MASKPPKEGDEQPATPPRIKIILKVKSSPISPSPLRQPESSSDIQAPAQNMSATPTKSSTQVEATEPAAPVPASPNPKSTTPNGPQSQKISTTQQPSTGLPTTQVPLQPHPEPATSKVSQPTKAAADMNQPVRPEAPSSNSQLPSSISSPAKPSPATVGSSDRQSTTKNPTMSPNDPDPKKASHGKWQQYTRGLKDTITALNKEVTTLNGVITTLKDEITTLKDEATTLKVEATTLRDEATSLRDEVISTQKKADEAIAEKEKQHREYLEGLCGVHVEIVDAAKKQYDEKIHLMEAEISDLKKDASRLSQLNVYALAQEVRILSKQLANSKESRKELSEEYKVLKKANESMIKDLKKISAQNENFAKDNERLLRINGTFEPRYASWQETVKIWVERFANHKASRDELQQNLEGQIEDLKTTHEASQVQLRKKYESEIANLEDSLETTQVQLRKDFENQIVDLEARLKLEQAKDNPRLVTDLQQKRMVAYQECYRQKKTIEHLQLRSSSAIERETRNMEEFRTTLAQKEEDHKHLLEQKEAEVARLSIIINEKDSLLTEKETKFSAVKAENSRLHDRLEKNTNARLDRIFSTPSMPLPTLKNPSPLPQVTSSKAASSDESTTDIGASTSISLSPGDAPGDKFPPQNESPTEGGASASKGLHPSDASGVPPGGSSTFPDESPTEGDAFDGDRTPPGHGASPGDHPSNGDPIWSIIPVLFPRNVCLGEKIVWFIFAFFRLLYAIGVFLHLLPRKIGVVPIKYMIQHGFRTIGVFLQISDPKPLTKAQNMGLWMEVMPYRQAKKTNEANKKMMTKLREAEEREHTDGQLGIVEDIFEGFRVIATLFITFMPWILFVADQYDQHLERKAAGLRVATSNSTIGLFEVPIMDVVSRDEVVDISAILEQLDIQAQNTTIDPEPFVEIIVNITLDESSSSTGVESSEPEKEQRERVDSAVLLAAAAVVVVVGVSFCLSRCW